MATAPAKNVAKDAKSDAAPKSKKKLIVILVVALVVLGGGAAAWAMLKPADKHAVKEAEPAKAPVFVPLETFTVNLQPAGGERYLQTTMVVQVEDDATAEVLKTYMPLVRNRLLALLATQDADTLATPDGKATLTRAVLAELKTPMDKGVEPLKTRAVLFNDFVIQ